MASKLSKREQLKALREARSSGRSAAFSDEADGTIYDEVDEDTYRQHKRDQLMNDDFIVDDNGEGYVDNGADEWDEASRPNYSSDEDDESLNKSKKRSRHGARSLQRPTKMTKSHEISNFFKTGSTLPNTKKLDTNIDDILDDFQDTAPLKKVKRESPLARSKNSFLASASTKKLPFDFSTSARPTKKAVTVSEKIVASPMPSSPVAVALDDDIIDAEIIEEGEEAPQVEKIETAPTMADSTDESEDEVVVTRRPRVAAPNKNRISNFSAVKADPVSAPTHSQISYTEKVQSDAVVSEADNSVFKMFWLDYCEVDNTILLFGKILTREGKLVSGLVQVNGLARELYFLPRTAEDETGESKTPLDVHKEVIPLLLEKYGLDQIKAKPETMKYAFEVSGVPKELEYLKVLLPFKTPKSRNLKLPQDLEGETFSRVFGTTSGLFESFVLQRDIKGPCWLEIKGGNFDSIQNTSHCQVEVSVSSPANVIPISEKAPPPPNLKVASIAVQTVMNPKLNKQEVVSVSLATYAEISQDAPIDENIKPTDIITLVRPVGSVSLPPGLSQLAEKQGFALRACPNEKVLLNCLSAIVKNVDPDVFIGHRLENISLDVLVHRMHDLKVTTWSTFGRRNRKSWPERFSRASNGFNNHFLIREIFQGRLICDVANEMGQSLTMKCQSWDLPEMYDVVCHKKMTPPEINYSNPQYGEDATFFLMALRENAHNAKITAEIAFATQILSLSKQLTNIAGNAWSHTLSGTRAGRNEFILLHEFNRNKYILPDREDKYSKNVNQNQQAKIELVEEDATTATSNKKPKYQGGLVFEPEKGLHKNYVLVMDFNSLYPSIIQEFNICFTTVDRDAFNLTHDEDRDMPLIPEREQAQGVLPKLLNSLVSRRREVKKLLKDPKISAFQRAQFDIKQQALKLTANSMYGCLGYVNSRFYAKPLAMLVTNKGREILMDTRQLAESIGLRVVYGDTDSVMIDTGVDSYEDAVKIGDEFKVQVNERYKLLEIEIDNVFKRLLLHAKKKYAAMSSSIDSKGVESTVLEVKGLDMRRREYCQLSKDISTFVLMKILSDQDPEQALSSVYDYLEQVSQKVKGNEYPIPQYRINTRLSKDPSAYPGGQTMPAVQAALRLRENGKVIKAGSVVTFAITAAADENDTLSPASRARPIQDLVKDKLIRPDPDYYLEKQIFAPVERLMERIEGVDMVRVASSLGIDTKRYVMRIRNSDGPNGEIMPIESSISDLERFRQSSYLVLKCKCGACFRFGGIQGSADYKVTFNGIQCAKCDYTFLALRMNAQLEKAIRQHISVYYAGWLVCDDVACGISTRQISVYGKRCLGNLGKAHGCKGMMRYRYLDKALYNQLLYFRSLFDVDKAKKNELRAVSDSGAVKLASGQVEALAEQNRELFGYSEDVVQKYLGDCGRRYVNMASVFDFMM